MDLKKILEYQTIDRRLYSEEVLLEKSTENQKREYYLKQSRDAHKQLTASDKDAEALFKDAVKLINDLEKVSKKRESLSVSKFSQDSQVNATQKELQAYSEEVQTADKECKRILKSLDEIEKGFPQLISRRAQNFKEHQKFDEEFKKKQGELTLKFKQDIEKLNALKAEIKPELFEKYKKLREQKKFPPFAPYENGSCICGIEVKIELGGKLNTAGDMAECPSCYRILFVK
ncbi:MAG: hypothetical protein FWD49_03650 [Firmicutes bacterium]|nr:hypothetical protein [Bacillota bacterium]